MAPRTAESKKRKASVPESGADKVKKVKQAAPPSAVEPAYPPKLVDAKDVYTPKDPNSKGEKRKATDEPNISKAKKSKKGIAATAASEKLVKSKKLKSTFATEETPELAAGEEDAGNSEVDDQTEALLKGFESEDDDDEEPNEAGFEVGSEVPAVKLSKKAKKQLAKANEAAEAEKPGVVYIGRIPHGFFEHEMREYFKQFGNITKLRLSRNKHTGASKHFAFIEFESSVVSDIVAKTMDNYLLFSHILKVKVVPEAQVPPNLFAGANKRFKAIPWNKLEARKLNSGTTEETWDKRSKASEERWKEKAEKLKKIGYEFIAPQMKSAKGLAKAHVDVPDVVEGEDTEVKAIEEAPQAEGKKESKKRGTKAAVKETNANVKSTQKQIEVEAKDSEDVVVDSIAKTKKAAKSKETKEAEPTEVTNAIAEPATENISKVRSKEGSKKVVEESESAVEHASAPVVQADEKPKKVAKRTVSSAENPPVAKVAKGRKGRKSV
ncbi:hypothetical protein BJ875DRAFT_495548 [Amylocarpus encephaloides]|uniref:RRM domain-containing protein n=1 Tax=Amylocarpus encephaloides TaxID=45428 RepID=A0A9P7YKN5_9HELO|nr:hypothetical protein BJ875DRAFT_495548 [Amylocarpus encephaloides]